MKDMACVIELIDVISDFRRIMGELNRKRLARCRRNFLRNC